MGDAGTPHIFAIVPIEVARDRRLTLMQTRVLIALLSFRNKNTNLVFPRRKLIAERCGYTLANISRTTSELVELGWLQKTGSGGRSKASRYRVTVPEQETVSEPETVSDPGTKTVPEPGTGIEDKREQKRTTTTTHAHEEDDFDEAQQIARKQFPKRNLDADRIRPLWIQFTLAKYTPMGIPQSWQTRWANWVKRERWDIDDERRTRNGSGPGRTDGRRETDIDRNARLARERYGV